MPEPVLADSVTKLGAEAAGRVVVTGSHGGVYAAYLARRSGCRAAIFHDAGVGLDGAGVGGLEWLERQGMAAAAVDHVSSEIGDAAKMLARGRVSRVNAPAATLGAAPGMRCTEVAARLAGAPLPDGPCPEIREGRAVLTPHGVKRRLVLTDSASLVEPGDAGHVVVTGSHGALFGGDPANALKVDAYLALFNDAGGTATSRLFALQSRGVAAATVGAASARIGEAYSTWQDGILSALNDAARELGGREDMRARDLVTMALRDE